MGLKLGRRLGLLEGAAWAREAALGPPVLVVYPDDWPAADRAAWDAAWAAGNQAARMALVGKHAGERPGPATTVLVFRLRPDGPQ